MEHQKVLICCVVIIAMFAKFINSLPVEKTAVESSKIETVNTDGDFARIISRSKRGIHNQRIRRMMMCLQLLKNKNLNPHRLPTTCRVLYCAQVRRVLGNNAPSFCFPDRRVISV